MLSTLVPHSASNTTRSIGREVLTALPTFSPHQIVGLRGRKLSSARKSAEQRALVCLISQTGYLMTEKFVLEFKKIDQEDDNSPQDALQSALQQIRDKEYAAELAGAWHSDNHRHRHRGGW